MDYILPVKIPTKYDLEQVVEESVQKIKDLKPELKMIPIMILDEIKNQISNWAKYFDGSKYICNIQLVPNGSNMCFSSYGFSSKKEDLVENPTTYSKYAISDDYNCWIFCSFQISEKALQRLK